MVGVPTGALGHPQHGATLLLSLSEQQETLRAGEDIHASVLPLGGANGQRYPGAVGTVQQGTARRPTHPAGDAPTTPHRATHSHHRRIVVGETTLDYYRVRSTTVHGQNDDVDGANSTGIGHLDRPNSHKVQKKHRSRITQCLGVLTRTHEHNTRTATRALLRR